MFKWRKMQKDVEKSKQKLLHKKVQCKEKCKILQERKEKEKTENHHHHNNNNNHDHHHNHTTPGLLLCEG